MNSIARNRDRVKKFHERHSTDLAKVGMTQERYLQGYDLRLKREPNLTPEQYCNIRKHSENNPDLQGAPERSQMISELVAADHQPENLDLMTDEELWQLLQQVRNNNPQGAYEFQESLARKKPDATTAALQKHWERFQRFYEGGKRNKVDLLRMYFEARRKRPGLKASEFFA